MLYLNRHGMVEPRDLEKLIDGKRFSLSSDNEGITLLNPVFRFYHTRPCKFRLDAVANHVIRIDGGFDFSKPIKLFYTESIQMLSDDPTHADSFDILKEMKQGPSPKNFPHCDSAYKWAKRIEKKFAKEYTVPYNKEYFSNANKFMQKFAGHTNMFEYYDLWAKEHQKESFAAKIIKYFK